MTVNIEFLGQQISAITNKDTGIPSGLFALEKNPFTPQVKAYLDQFAERGNAITQFNLFRAADREIKGAITKTDDPLTCQFLAQVHQQVINRLPRASIQTAELISADSVNKRAQGFFQAYFLTLDNKHFGNGGRGDISNSSRQFLEATMEALMPEELGQAKDVNVIQQVMMGGVDAAFEAMEKAHDENEDQRQRAFKTLLWLMKDSPLAQGLLKREKEGHGVRESEAYEPVESYLIAKMLGNEFDKFDLNPGEPVNGVLRALFSYVVTSEDEKPKELSIAAQQWLASVNDASLAGEIDLDQLNRFGAGYHAAQERLPDILRGSPYEGLYILLSIVRQISPYTYTTMLAAHDSARQQTDKDKRKPHQKRRQKAQEALAEKRDTAAKSEKYYAQFNAGTIEDPSMVEELPKNDGELVEFLEVLFEIDGINIADRHAANSSYILSGTGQENGTRHLLSEEWNKDEEKIVKSCLDQFFGQLKAVVESPDFYRKGNESLNNAAAFYLLSAGKILEQTAGESEELKQAYRQKAGQLAYRVMHNPEAAPALRLAAERFFEYHFPYWPIEAQKQVFNSWVDTVKYGSGAWGWIEQGGADFWISVAVQINDDLKRPVPEQVGRQRPMAEHIADGLISLVKDYQGLAGKNKRENRSPIELILGSDRFAKISGLKAQAMPDLDFLSRVIDQIGLIYPIKNDQLREAFEQICGTDQSRLAELMVPMPADTREFAAQLDKSYKQTSAALASVWSEYMAAIENIAGLNQQAFFEYDQAGRIIGIQNAPNLTEVLTEEGQQALTALSQKVGLEAALEQADNLEEQALEESQAPAVDLAKIIVDIVNQATVEGIDPEALAEALRPTMQRIDETAQETGLPSRMVWLGSGGGAGNTLAFLVTALSESKSEAAQAFVQWVEAILKDRDASRQLGLDLVDRTGVLARTKAGEELRQQIIEAMADLITKEHSTQAAIQGFKHNIQERAAQVAAKMAGLETQFQESKIVLADQQQEALLDQAQLELDLIKSQTEVRLESARKALAGFERTVPDLVEKLIEIGGANFRLMFENQGAWANWIIEMVKSDGPVIRLANTVEDTLRQPMPGFRLTPLNVSALIANRRSKDMAQEVLPDKKSPQIEDVAGKLSN